MKVLYSAFLASLASFAPSRVTVAGQCIKGSFEVHFDGPCNTENIVAAFESQVFNQPMYDCPGTAAAEFTAQLNGKTVQDLCTDIVSDGVSLDEVVGVEGPEFLKNYYNGRTNWNDERQTETGEDTKVLKEQASTINVYEEFAQDTTFEWPGHLSQFNLDECVSKTAYCCWVQDRQANDNNGNCASPYDTNCIDKDPGDNTDLCYVDLGRYDGHGTVGSGFFLFEHDNNKGEGAIHCHGQAWAADDSDYLSRYKGNNLFYISMYDHMYVRGYVREVPGAPMCGCSEKMPVVSRSDCTQTNVSEKFELHKKDGVLTVELKDLNLGFQACQAENNNDLESYVQKLVNEGKLTATHQAKFKESVVGNGQCSVAKAALLESKGLSTGFDNDDEMWLPIIGKGGLLVSNPINDPIQFKNQFAARPNQIVRRVCTSCIASHKDIYYRRLTPVPSSMDLLELLKSNWSVVNNNFGDPANNVAADFALYSSYADAIADTNRWQFCNFDGGVGFPRDCGPYGRVNSNWNSWKSTSGMAQDVAFYIEKETGGGAGGDGDVVPVLNNLAVNGTCYQSSTAHGGVCERAIDNNFSGVWNHGSTTHTKWNKNPWWMVDLGSVKAIDSVVFANRQDCCTNRLKNIRVEVMGGLVGPVIKEVYMEGQLNRLNTADMEGVEGRFVKVTSVTTGDEHNVLSLAEVAVYGEDVENQPEPLTNFALNSTLVMQQTTGYGWIAPRAVDDQFGKYSTTHTWSSKDPWWSCYFGPTSVKEVILFNRPDCCQSRLHDVTVELFSDVGMTDLVGTKSIVGAVDFAAGVFFEGDGVLASAVKVTVDNSAGSQPMSLNEVQVFGTRNEIVASAVDMANVALGKPATQSSTAYGGVASRGTDGNTGPNWNSSGLTHTTYSAQPWWQVDLENSYAVQQVLIVNRQDCCWDRLNNVNIELLDQVDGTVVASRFIEGQVSRGGTGIVEFDGERGSAVRVSLSGNGILTLGEVAVIADLKSKGEIGGDPLPLTPAPTKAPSPAPSMAKTNEPSRTPSSSPSATASVSPTTIPSASPSAAENIGTTAPSASEVKETASPSAAGVKETAAPSAADVDGTSAPSSVEVAKVTAKPSTSPSVAPSEVASAAPSDGPSAAPSEVASASPSDGPSAAPSEVDSAAPSNTPTAVSSEVPSTAPSVVPTESQEPSQSPSAVEEKQTLQEAIIKDMMPPSSIECIASDGFVSDFTFESSAVSSEWDADFADYESSLFLAKMTHNDDRDDRKWTVRIGQAGNIYSFVGPMGETVPPQNHDKAPWVDEVWQSVSVDQNLNGPGAPYFIHQAGVYQKDSDYTNGVSLEEVPFYSPSLGKYCKDSSSECGFSSWGQHAHVPTEYESGVIYMDRYKDCGDGVMEYTTLRHVNVGNTDKMDYLNVPWGGVRTSNLRDLVLTFNTDVATTATNSQELIEPILGWGNDNGYPDHQNLPKIQETLGYAMFAEDLPTQNLPTFETPCSADNATACLELTFAGDCSESPNHTESLGKYTLRCPLVETILVKTGDSNPIKFTNPGTGAESTFTNGVHHWAWNSNSLYAFPDEDAAAFNEKFGAGATVEVSYFDTATKTAEENLVLAHVYGTEEKWSSRLRFGSSSRDYTVYTVNSVPPDLTNGRTYFYRQYFIMDKYSEMSSKGPTWALQSYQEVYDPYDESEESTIADEAIEAPSGRKVTLYSSDGSSTFGATLSGKTCNLNQEAVAQCEGTTTPRPGSKALYHIKCGNESYVGSDPYHFSPSGNVRRPYVCFNDSTVRATWDLLGFFPEGSCANIQQTEYDAEYC